MGISDRFQPPKTLEELGDPMRPPVPEQSRAPNVTRPQHLEDPEDYKKNDPVQQVIDYVNRFWIQELAPIRTRCYRCRQDSPVVHIPPGALTFGTRRLRPREVDVTKQAVEEFAKVGWKLQLRRSYCPNCKNLGSVD